MKSLLTFAFVLLLASCATVKYAESVYVFDYRNHDYPGFIVSLTVTGMDYEPLADITLEFSCGKLPSGADTTGLESYPNPYNMKLYRPTTRHILNQCIKAAMEFGADAIINFKTESQAIGGTGQVTARGIAVKLKQQ